MKSTLFPVMLLTAVFSMMVLFGGCSGEDLVMPNGEAQFVGENTVNLEMGLGAFEFATVAVDTTPPPPPPNPDKKPDPEVEMIIWEEVKAFYH